MSDVAANAVLGGIASATACIVSNPLDTLRTRLQCASRQAPRGLQLASGLQRGLAPAMAYNLTLNSTRFALHGGLHGSGALSPVTSGLAAGLVAGFLSSPLARARTLLQAAAPSNAPASLRALASGAFAGAPSWALRNAGHTACIFTVFEHAKRLVEASSPELAPAAVHATASLGAATASVLVMNPLDVACARAFATSARRAAGGGASAFECAARLVAAEGPAGLYRGLLPNLLRTVPHTVLTFTLVEALRPLATSSTSE